MTDGNTSPPRREADGSAAHDDRTRLAEAPLLLLAGAAGWPAPLLELLRGRFRLEMAATATEALRRLGELRPALLLVGPDLPDATATELCRRVRADKKRRQLSIAGVRPAEDAQEQALLTAGANRALAWPTAPDALFDAFHALCHVAVRRDARLPVRITVELLGAPGLTIGYSQNLSVTGMLLEAKLAPTLGMGLDLHFTVPNHRVEISAHAEVVRVHTQVVSRTQFGVRYRSLAAGDRDAIDRFIDNGRRLGTLRG